MNKDFLNELPADEQPVAKKLQSLAEDIQAPPAFQAKLESQLLETHKEKISRTLEWQSRLLPSLGWAILIISAVFLLNWALRSLMPKQLPATEGTPDPNISFEENVKAGNICQGQLTVGHDYSVFLSSPDKTGFTALDEQENIGELRSFSWSSDGRELAIVGNTRGSGNIYLADTTENLLQPVLSNSELGYLVGVAWSSDGSQLLTWEINNNTKVHLLTKDGASIAKIDLPVQFFETPQFAPNGESILFYGANSTTAGLFQVSMDGAQITTISTLVENESSFAWSPDGSRLAYIEMDRDIGEARLIVDSNGDKLVAASLPISTGSGSSIPDSANLSWSSDGKSLVFEYGRNASDRVIYLANIDNQELVKLAESAYAPAISSNGNCLAYISNQQIFLMDLATTGLTSTAASSPILLADLPSGRARSDFQLDKLQWKPGTESVPDIQGEIKTIPTPSGTEYDWRGIKLYVDTSLPIAPTQAGLYEAQLDRHATLDSARTLAAQFGIAGEIYETLPELGGSNTTDFLVVDGNQRLQVRSNLYFSYYPDYPRWNNNTSPGTGIDQATAENLIGNFLRTHGFNFDYKVEYSEFYNGYYALPLTTEGLAIRHNHFGAAGFLFRFADDEIVAVEASLVTYSLVDNFEVIPSEEALQKLLEPNTVAGILEGTHSVSEPVQTWNRFYPENQTITVWGWISSFKSAKGGTPLVTFDGYQASGNLAGLAESTPNTFVEATGQFQTVEGNRIFNIESWQIFDGHEEGFGGTIQRNGNQVVLETFEGAKLALPNFPADLSLPMENVFVLGITRGDVFEWKSIDNRSMQGGGGGGGGGGSGFYKPNLTGTPVPLPEPQVPSTGTGDYIVKEGDTLSAIADVYGTTVDELMQANGLTDATIFIGQTLVVPGMAEEQSLIGQRLNGQRGTLLIFIVNKPDGSQSVDYRLQYEEGNNQSHLIKLEGDNLDELQTHNNLPVDAWGTVERYESDFGMQMPVLKVERFKFPYPDLQFQILKGTQSITTVGNDTITLFTTEDGQTYAQANTYNGLIGKEGDQILMEVLVMPNETVAGYPVIRVFGAGLAINPKNGEPVEMEVTANQPYINNESDQPEMSAEITATVENVELVYFTPNQRYTVPDSTAEPVYIQPAWRFQGHYWDGSEFEILVQALKEEYLLPEIESIEPPG